MWNNKLKLWWHKLQHWEYWPATVVYLPTLLFWIFLFLRFRHHKFYKYANPKINNGGLYDVSKMSIYQLLPLHTYPTTIMVESGNAESAIYKLHNAGIMYPVIAKPDKGYRGIGVQKLDDAKSLRKYFSEIKSPVLLQQYCDYENEMGVFCYRLPGQSKFCVSGITLKKFLTIQGDGQHTIAQLLARSPRSAMQIKKLQHQWDLQSIPAMGEVLTLVPYGNHNRGTQFIDGKALINEALISTINNILQYTEGIYYGRLDIRYRSMAEFLMGQGFKIIELNGAMSEPTHIYDEHTSFWKGQKEIFRHQFIFAKIIGAQIKMTHKQKEN